MIPATLACVVAAAMGAASAFKLTPKSVRCETSAWPYNPFGLYVERPTQAPGLAGAPTVEAQQMERLNETMAIITDEIVAHFEVGMAHGQPPVAVPTGDTRPGTVENEQRGETSPRDESPVRGPSQIGDLPF